MDYIIYNSDGSIATKKLKNYVQQGSDGVNTLFCAIPSLENPDECTVQVVFTLPNQSQNTLIATYQHDFTYDEDEEPLDGWTFALTTAQTIYFGILLTSLRIIRNQNLILVTYPFALVVNETGVSPSTDSGIPLDSLDSLIESLKLYIDENIPYYTSGTNIQISSNYVIRTNPDVEFSTILVGSSTPGTAGLYVNSSGDAGFTYSNSGDLSSDIRIIEGTPELINRSENYQSSLIVGTDGIEIEKKDLVNNVTVRKDLFDLGMHVISCSSLPYTCTAEELAWINNEPENVLIVYSDNIYRYTRTGTTAITYGRFTPTNNGVGVHTLTVTKASGYIGSATNSITVPVVTGTANAAGTKWESLTIGGVTHTVAGTQLYKHYVNIPSVTGYLELYSISPSSITSINDLAMHFVMYGTLRALFLGVISGNLNTIPIVLSINTGTSTISGFDANGSYQSVYISDATLTDTVTEL